MTIQEKVEILREKVQQLEREEARVSQAKDELGRMRETITDLKKRLDETPTFELAERLGALQQSAASMEAAVKRLEEGFVANRRKAIYGGDIKKLYQDIVNEYRADPPNMGELKRELEEACKEVLRINSKISEQRGEVSDAAFKLADSTNARKYILAVIESQMDIRLHNYSTGGGLPGDVVARLETIIE